LLNKDVETLLEAQGCRLVDVRHTAGNLRLLMSVLVGGEGDVPRRGKGQGEVGEEEVEDEDEARRLRGVET